MEGSGYLPGKGLMEKKGTKIANDHQMFLYYLKTNILIFCCVILSHWNSNILVTHYSLTFAPPPMKLGEIEHQILNTKIDHVYFYFSSNWMKFH